MWGAYSREVVTLEEEGTSVIGSLLSPKRRLTRANKDATKNVLQLRQRESGIPVYFTTMHFYVKQSVYEGKKVACVLWLILKPNCLSSCIICTYYINWSLSSVIYVINNMDGHVVKLLILG